MLATRISQEEACSTSFPTRRRISSRGCGSSAASTATIRRSGTDQPSRRPKPAGEVDPPVGAVQRAASLGAGGSSRSRRCPAALHRGAALLWAGAGWRATSSRRRNGSGWIPGGSPLHGDPAGNAQGDARVCADPAREGGGAPADRVKRWEARLSPWSERMRDFRAEGFYERFAAKGQVERVGRIHRELARAVGLE